LVSDTEATVAVTFNHFRELSGLPLLGVDEEPEQEHEH